jgi:CMP-N-acetylneuraminic acid synthetase
MDIIAIIPARGGSKGIPGKNLVELCGKPLIAYSIEPALRSGVFKKVIVSTDDPQIAKVAKRLGAEVPFLRPKKFATDCSSIQDALSYTSKQLYLREGIEPWAIGYLYPSYPFRTANDLRFMVELLKRGFYAVDMRRFETLLPGNFYGLNKVKKSTFDLGPGRYLSCFRVIINSTVMRTPPWRFLYGSKKYPRKNYWITRWARNDPVLSLIRNKFSRNLVAYLKVDQWRAMDIDSYEDLMIAREVIKRGWFDFEKGVCRRWIAGYELRLPG